MQIDNSGQTGLCVHPFYPYIFPSQINIINPKNNDCSLNSLPSWNQSLSVCLTVREDIFDVIYGFVLL